MCQRPLKKIHVRYWSPSRIFQHNIFLLISGAFLLRFLKRQLEVIICSLTALTAAYRERFVRF